MSRFRARPLWFLLLAPIALPALLALLFAWVVATESGTRFGLWTAQIILPGVGIESPAGTLLGPLRIGRLSYRSADRRISAEQVGIEWKPRRLMERELAIDRLSIDRLRIDSRGDQPLQAPDDLRLPLALRVDALAIARIAFGALAEGESKPAVELSDVAARLASDGADHRIESLRFHSPRGSPSRAAAACKAWRHSPSPRRRASSARRKAIPSPSPCPPPARCAPWRCRRARKAARWK